MVLKLGEWSLSWGSGPQVERSGHGKAFQVRGRFQVVNVTWIFCVGVMKSAQAVESCLSCGSIIRTT